MRIMMKEGIACEYSSHRRRIRYADVMTIDAWMRQLAQEGFEDLRVCPMPPNQDLPEHTHDDHTVHVIVEGELTIIDADGTKTYRPGDRVEFSAGTTHKARGSTENGTMIVGRRKILSVDVRISPTARSRHSSPPPRVPAS